MMVNPLPIPISDELKVLGVTVKENLNLTGFINKKVSSAHFI